MHKNLHSNNPSGVNIVHFLQYGCMMVKYVFTWNNFENHKTVLLAFDLIWCEYFIQLKRFIWSPLLVSYEKNIISSGKNVSNESFFWHLKSLLKRESRPDDVKWFIIRAHRWKNLKSISDCFLYYKNIQVCIKRKFS